MYNFLSISDILSDKLSTAILSINLILFCFSVSFTIIYYKFKKLDNLLFDLSFIVLAIIFAIIFCFTGNLITSFAIYEMLTLVTIPIICKRKDFFYAKYLLFLSLLLLLPLVLILSLKDNITNYTAIISDEMILFFSIFAIAKMGLISTHYWLLNAKQASYPISAILHAVIMINSGILMYIKMHKMIYLNNQFIINPSNINIFLPGVIIFFLSCLYSCIKCILSTDIKEFLIFSTIKASSFILLIFNLFVFDRNINLYIDLILLHSFTKFFIFVLFAFSDIRDITKLQKGFQDYKIQTLLKITLASVLIFDSGIFKLSPMGQIKEAILLHNIFQTSIYNISPLIFLYAFNLLNFLTYCYIFRVVIYLFKKIKIYTFINK